MITSIILAPGVYAFSGDEHKDISNAGLFIALGCLGDQSAEPQLTPLGRDINQQLKEILSKENFDLKRTYGHLVALADQVTGVEKYFDAAQRTAGPPNDVEAIPWEYIELRWTSPFRNAQALHLNEGHFQHDAQFNHWFWHRQAVNAALSGHLGEAIMLSAYADHFLQDFLAPGHVIARRRTSDDMTSLNAVLSPLRNDHADGELAATSSPYALSYAEPTSPRTTTEPRVGREVPPLL